VMDPPNEGTHGRTEYPATVGLPWRRMSPFKGFQRRGAEQEEFMNRNSASETCYLLVRPRDAALKNEPAPLSQVNVTGLGGGGQRGQAFAVGGPKTV